MLFLGVAAMLAVGAAVVYRSRHVQTLEEPTLARVQPHGSLTPIPTDTAVPSPTDTPKWPKPIVSPESADPAADNRLAPTPPAIVQARPEQAPEARPPPPRPTTIANVSVVVYTTSWCPHCREAKAWMASRGIAYEERNIEASMSNELMMKQINARGGVPTFDVDGDVMVGFSADALASMLQRARARQAARSL
jgi:glutaredoxin